MNRNILLGVVGVVGMFASVACAGPVLVYQNDFATDQSAGPEWVTNPDWNSAQNFGGFLGRFGQETQILELGAYNDGHGGGNGGGDNGGGDNGGGDNGGSGGGQSGGRSATNYTLTFDLYLLDSWDGAYAGEFGPDYFGVSANGESLLWEGWHGTKPWKNIVDPDVGPVNLGFNDRYTDSIFRDLTLSFSVAPDVDLLRISFIGAPSSVNLNDESWGIDNVRLTAEVVPAPGTLALGVLGLAGMRRRRKG
jgi:uncharacterized protein (TIGR03382 family)